MNYIKLANTLNNIALLGMKKSRDLLKFLYPELKTDSYFVRLSALHNKIDNELRIQKKEYPHFIYEQGFLYQAFHSLNIFGVRSTERRYSQYKLDKLIHESDYILDIGCNCGFMLIYTIFRKGCSGVGIDINPHMIQIGTDVSKFLELSEKVTLIPDSFMTYNPDKKFTIIFSFAAYWTDDCLLRPDFSMYMNKIYSLLEDKGMVIFETHCSDANNPEFHKKLESFRDLFSWEGSDLIDNNMREVFILTKK